jgi:hypothetical protein
MKIDLLVKTIMILAFLGCNQIINDDYTSSGFCGEYLYNPSNNIWYTAKLYIKKDQTFEFVDRSCTGENFISGNWELIGRNLSLTESNNKKLNKIDEFYLDSLHKEGIFQFNIHELGINSWKFSIRKNKLRQLNSENFKGRIYNKIE